MKINLTQWIEFLKKWNNRHDTDWKHLRYGQAFVNYMALECNIKPPPDQTQRLFYTTDNDEAVRLMFNWVDWTSS